MTFATDDVGYAGFFGDICVLEQPRLKVGGRTRPRWTKPRVDDVRSKPVAVAQVSVELCAALVGRDGRFGIFWRQVSGAPVFGVVVGIAQWGISVFVYRPAGRSAGPPPGLSEPVSRSSGLVIFCSLPFARRDIAASSALTPRRCQ